MAAPLVGRKVSISGLASRPELNGAKGIAIAFDDAKGRYTVRLDSGENCSLKPTNVAAADSGGGDGGSGGMPGFGAGMPGMAGMGAGGAQAAAMHALFAQLRDRFNLPPGVTPGHLGIGLVVCVFLLPRVLGIGTMRPG